MSHSLFSIDAEGAYREASPDEVISAARRVLANRVCRGRALTSPSVTRDFLAMKLGTREHEVFCLMFLDNRHRVIDFLEIFRGTVDGASVHPREVIKEALQRNAAAVIFVHNHPSGVAEPSQADELITRRLRDALAIIDIRTLDHFIVAGDAVMSFAERGLL